MELKELPSSIPQDSNERRAIKSYCDEYVSSVTEVSNVKIWRDKVFAHFANTHPFSSDNDALLQQVSFYPISYRQGLLEVGGFQLFSGAPDLLTEDSLNQEHGSGLPAWTITEVFSSLTERYTLSTESDA